MEEKRCDAKFALKLGFDIVKVMLKAASMAAAFCLVKEVHKVHKAIEKHDHK